MGLNIGVGIDSTKTGATASGTSTSTSQKILTQEGFDKIIRDILASDQGLAALSTGEASAGMSGSATKTLLAQQLVLDTAATLASITAPTITTKQEESQQQQTQTKKSGGLKTVICTELMRQGKLDTELYLAGTNHFLSLHPAIVRGYRVWANKIVPHMQKSERLSNLFVPIVRARYEHITGRRKNLLGALTCWIGHPICFMIGQFVPEKEEYGYTT